MEKISFTYFVDFVLKAGTPKLTGVKEYKQHRFDVHADFYRPLREALVDMHAHGRPDAVLDHLLANLRDERKRRIYPALVGGYRRFLRSGSVAWFTPPQAAWPVGELSINVNPELGLEIDGTPHVIKTYFRGEPLSARRVGLVCNLMTAALRPLSPDAVFAVLDVKNGRLHSLKSGPSARVDVLLRGEAASFSTMYAAV